MADTALPRAQALVVAGKRHNAERILATDTAAEDRGLRVGLTLAEARARYPDLCVMPEDAAADAQLLERMAEWALRYTPLVACDPPDGLLLDISGCAHLFGGERAILDDCTRRLERFGFTARAAIAGSIGAAWAMARFGNSASAILVSEGETDALSRLPLAALRLAEDVVGAMGRVGLKRIGDIIGLPRAPLAARFGREPLRQLDRALGREREPLTPRLPVAPYIAEQRFAEPIVYEEHVLAATERLAGRLRTMLEQRGEGARHIELTLFRTDGAVKRVAAATSRPVREAGDIRALFTERLAALADDLDPGFGFDLARLSVRVAEPRAPEQIGLSEDSHAGDLDRLVDRLGARLGSRHVARLIAQDSHIPETASIEMPAQACARADSGGPGAGYGWPDFRRFRETAALSPRPLRLLAKPEPIDALAMVPDGPPLRFRWRAVLHEVIASEGPERIEGAWWSAEEGPARDYFRVEDMQGRRFWLFRAGLYRHTAHPQWFLHGTFA